MKRAFDHVPFVVGSIRGERSWNFEHGVLRSPQYHHHWSAEENVSTCLRQGGETLAEVEEGLHRSGLIPPEGVLVDVIVNGWGARGGRIGPSSSDVVECTWRRTMRAPITPDFPPRGITVIPGGELTAEITGTVVLNTTFFQNLLNGYRRERPHQYDKCTCGFYAYLNGFNEYNSVTRVTGIIEGYGETLIGSRGFRAQKARILALAPGEDEKLPDGSISASMNRSAASLRAMMGLGVDPIKPKKLRKTFPKIAVFNDLQTMRAEFPPTDVSEVME